MNEIIKSSSMNVKNIKEIDGNFKERKIDDTGMIDYHDYCRENFELSGFAWFKSERKLCRLPESILPFTSPGTRTLAWNASGGALRFKTDSPDIAIKAELLSIINMNHMPRTGSSGFDLYVGRGKEKKYFSTLAPDSGSNAVEGKFRGFMERRMREYTLYFPLYNGIKSLQIGLASDSEIKPPMPFKTSKPLLFYGASVVQGGCASRPGNAHGNILARWIDSGHINLGFSGNARGEKVIAEAIGSLDISLLYMDYDQGEFEAFEQNHERFFQEIRRSQPFLPIIIASKLAPKPDYEMKNEMNCRRIEVIKRTYENAIGNGDRNVYYVDNSGLYGGKHRDSCTVDGIHPNDYGFMRIAENILPTVKKALKIEVP